MENNRKKTIEELEAYGLELVKQMVKLKENEDCAYITYAEYAENLTSIAKFIEVLLQVEQKFSSAVCVPTINEEESNINEIKVKCTMTNIDDLKELIRQAESIFGQFEEKIKEIRGFEPQLS